MGDLPLPDADLPTALGIWRTWLAGHDAGLAPIAEPNRFQWAGWWIAIVRHDQASTTGPREIAAVAFGSPPGIVLSPAEPDLVGRRPRGPRARR